MNRPMCLLLVLAAAGTARAQSSTAYRVDTVAGSAANGDGGPALQAQMGAVQGVAVDRSGNLYLSDTDNHRVRKVTPDGIIRTVAGTGIAGFAGDGGPATAALLNLPYGLAADGAGNLYIADLGNNRIRRVAPDGTMSTYAGGGALLANDEGVPAISTALRTPRNVTLDAAGNLYLSEFEGHRIRKVTPDGRIATVAGSGVAGFRGDGGAATAAQLAYPAGVALDRAGNLYIADSQNQRVRKVAPEGAISTVAGGSATTIRIPTAVVVDAAGTLYVSDGSGSVRVCSTAAACPFLPGAQTAGDLALDAAGIVYVADGTQVRRIDPHGSVSTVAGDGYLHAIGDGGPATAALLFQPTAVALDRAGNLYIADSGTQRVRQVSPSGSIQTVAGTGVAGSGATNLHSPSGVAITPAGDLAIADTGNHVVRKLSGGVLTTIAGTGSAGASPEGLSPTQTALNSPRGLCAGSDGSLFIVDTGNHRVLRITGGTVQTAAGNGSPGSAGDGGPARLAQLNRPTACAVDPAGNLLIADTANQRIRKVGTGGVISTVAGTSLNAPSGVAADAAGSVFIADSGNHRICLLTPDGVLHTIAGPGQVRSPGGLAFDTSGMLYVADTGNNRVQRLVPVTLSVVNAASLAPGPVSPGEMVTIFGGGMGPDAGATASFDSDGMLPLELGGTEVRFDGAATPLLYAQSGQINAQAPYNLAGPTTHVQVLFQGQTISETDLAVTAAAPALFPSSITQDNPAARGAVAVFYATGEGLTIGPNIAGKAAAAPFPQPALPVTLTIAGVPAQLLYAGSAPGTAGVMQISAVIPGGFLSGGSAIVRLSVGSAVSPPLTIWLQ